MLSLSLLFWVQHKLAASYRSFSSENALMFCWTLVNHSRRHHCSYRGHKRQRVVSSKTSGFRGHTLLSCSCVQSIRSLQKSYWSFQNLTRCHCYWYLIHHLLYQFRRIRNWHYLEVQQPLGLRRNPFLVRCLQLLFAVRRNCLLWRFSSSTFYVLLIFERINRFSNLNYKLFSTWLSYMFNIYIWNIYYRNLGKWQHFRNN